MKIDISIGELIDKLTILSIKLDKVKAAEKRKNIDKEYNLLLAPMKEIGITINSEEFVSLKKVNLTLWEIEDNIRKKEAAKEFDEEFIHLARSVYFENDKRAAIKKQINITFNSDLVEEKEYINYS